MKIFMKIYVGGELPPPPVQFKHFLQIIIVYV